MENIHLEFQKIKSEFQRIKNLGFVENKRPTSKDGGIGNTFEDLLGVKENNLKDADFMGFEVKSKRIFNESYLSLFTKSPSHPKGANRILKDNFGEVRNEDFPGSKKLYASIFGNRHSLIYSKFNMKLELDRNNDQLKLVIKDENFNLLNEDVFWTFESLQKASAKINKLFVVYADSMIQNGVTQFHYKEAEVFLDFNFEAFLNFISEGKIMFDIRIGVHKSGKQKGKAHDHGSGFRIKANDLSGVYKEYLKLE